MTDAIESALDALDDILERMDVDAHAELKDGEDATVLEIQGSEAEELANGEILDALQHLVNRIASRDVVGDYQPVAVDAGGWRARRQSELSDLARDLADEARQSGRPTTAPKLSPYERRLVHLALEEEEGIFTRSEGEGRQRRLRVYPN